MSGYEEKENALLLNIPLASMNALGTIASIFLIDRFGRRYIMLRSLPFIMVGWILVAIGMGMTGSQDLTT